MTGILLAPGTEAIKVDRFDLETVEFSDYAAELSDSLTVIGYDWKSFDFTSGRIIAPNTAYCVKSKNGGTYKLVFYDFEGSSTRITTFEKTLVGTTSVKNSHNNIDLKIYPNPSTE